MAEKLQPTGDNPFGQNEAERQYEGYFGINTDTRLNIIDMFVKDGRNFRAEMVDSLDLDHNGVLLDIGCGNGTLLIDTRKRRDFQGLTIGVDIDKSSLDEAKKKELARGLTPSIYLAADMEQINLPDNSVDTILCSFAFHHANHLDAAIHEAWRLLRPGGQLITSANSLLQKTEHSNLLLAITEYLKTTYQTNIKPPIAFASKFNSETAQQRLEQHFGKVKPIIPQRSELQFGKDFFGYLENSLSTYQSEFRPPIIGPGHWTEAVEKAARPLFDAAVAKYGYFQDNVDRTAFDCRKAA